MKDLRYPVGEFRPPTEMTTEQRARFIDQIAEMPSLLRRAVEGLSHGQLDTPYRPGGWTVRQVVHHIPDSHLNGYVRMKLALTALHKYSDGVNKCTLIMQPLLNKCAKLQFIKRLTFQSDGFNVHAIAA